MRVLHIRAGAGDCGGKSWKHWNPGRKVDCKPDLTLYFDVSVALGQQRVGAIKTRDRFEQEQLDFHQRVREAYLMRARQFPQRIRVIDACQPVDAVKAAVEHLLNNLLATGSE